MPKKSTKTPCQGGVYRITCLANSKSYIGSTRYPFNARWGKHRSALINGNHCNQHLQRAWNAYTNESEKAFEFCILEAVQFVEDLNDCEQKWIDMYQAFNHDYGFNIKPRADHRCHAEETKAKIGAANRGKKRTAEVRERLRILHTGKKLTTEHRAKMSASRTGKKHTPEALARMSAAQTGREKTPEQIEKHRAKMTGRTLTDEHRAKMSAAAIGRKNAPGSAAKMIASRIENSQFFYRATSSSGAVYDLILNLREFCRDKELNYAAMIRIASGIQKQHKGWTCKKLLKSDLSPVEN